MEATDAAVVAQVLAGERERFRVLVERHSRSIFKVAYRMTSNEQDAEEVVQETFLKAYRRLEGFESRANFKTWLYRIAVNCAIDLLNARRPTEPITMSDAYDEESGPEIQLAAEGPSPERMTLSGEVRRRLKSAMAKLTQTERTAFVLRHYEGVSIDEIARVLGVKNGAAKNTVFRAVQKLRRELEPVAGAAR
jgi:RNA polymerase sigma-70 factor (ECF subfamily)